MSILHHLTLRHLKLNKKRTWITIIGIALSVAMITAISSLVVSFQDLMYRDAVDREGLWHVRYAGLDNETIQKVVEEPIFSQWSIVTDEEAGQMLSLQFEKLNKDIFSQSEAVCFQYGIEQDNVSYHTNLLMAKGIVPGPYYDALYTFAAILLTLVAIGSVLVIANAFTISTDQRTQQFGLLKSTGATHRQVRGMVLFEGLALAVVGIPIGIAGGFVAAGCALAIANHFFEKMAAIQFGVQFRFVVSFEALAISIVCALITILISAWLPARRAGKISPVEAIRQSTRLKLTRRNVRVTLSPFMYKLFGFEGLLAAKTMKRSRSRYRTAIISLVVSIVLFIGVSSFAQTLVRATSIVYEDLGSNGALSLYSEEEETCNAVYEELSGWDGIDLWYNRRLISLLDLPDAYKTALYLEKFGNVPLFCTIYTLDPASMSELSDQYGFDFLTEPNSSSTVKALLINTTGTVAEQGRRMNFTPFNMPVGTQIETQSWDTPFEIAGEIDFIPTAVRLSFPGVHVSLIVSQDVFLQLKNPDDTDSMLIAVEAADIKAFEEKLTPYVSSIMPEDSFYWLDYDAAMANSRNLMVLVMTFVYGFIAMLSLIAITNVITTISTSISLRKGELAMLRSIGMTDKGIEKMLQYENLLYGTKALVIGIPIGLIASFAMHKAINRVMDFEPIVPVNSVLISIAAVFILTFATQLYAKSKVQSANIAQSLRDGNI